MKGPAIRTIMVVAGQSGGHIFPAVAFCQQVEESARPVKVIFVTAKSHGLEEFLSPGVDTRIWHTRRSPMGILRLFLKTAGILWKEKPDAVIGFGGYMTVPFVVLGRLAGAFVVIHEQNVSLGRANRFLSFWADRIVVSFSRTQTAFGRNNRKVVLARYPVRKGMVRQDRRQALASLGLPDGYFTVLVAGGSQGSRRLNETFVEALKMNQNRARIQVIHLAGRQDESEVRKAYQEMNAQAKVFAFLSRMDCAYSAADLIVARSGAGSVQEIILFGLPSILVPYPYAGGHQVENAKVLAEKGAALMVEEKRLNPSVLNGLLNIFLDDPMRRKTMSALARSLEENAQETTLMDVIP
ncbi:MAG: UDP-N-acetylglucosamine--N-acetylmuramyl-(pentapeptide) pyrophosphoryl-undecaprenol N-acetylglucosamine transferase [Candidatus Omnitrophota bacterium]